MDSAGTVLGVVGQIHPTLLEKLDVDKPVYGAEIYYGKLKKYFNDKIMFKAISKFPPIERDIAVLLDADIPCASVIDEIKLFGGEFLDTVSLFDVYQGAQVEAGKKSMAFNLIFVSEDRTLSVEEIDKTISDILSNLKVKLGAELR